jgi:electron transfer flavoprotein beta subunit
MTVHAVCIKWVDRRPEVDPSGAVAEADSRFAGVSPADQAALEWALRARDALGGELLAVTVGPPAAEGALRDALAAGVDRAVRIAASSGLDSALVAAVIAPLLRDATTVWCGDHSLDRGTGSVPAFLAAELGCAQALGLVQVSFDAPPAVQALRRLDGGRRERLAVTAPAVLSVEGATASLRRAPLKASLASRTAEIGVVAGPPQITEHVHRPTRAYRPRARVLPPPVGTTALQRVRALTDADAAAASHGETVVLDPPEAAERILAVLEEWGYR